MDGEAQIADCCTDMAAVVVAMPDRWQEEEAVVGDLLFEHKIQPDKTAAPGCETFFTQRSVW